MAVKQSTSLLLHVLTLSIHPISAPKPWQKVVAMTRSQAIRSLSLPFHQLREMRREGERKKGAKTGPKNNFVGERQTVGEVSHGAILNVHLQGKYETLFSPSAIETFRQFVLVPFATFAVGVEQPLCVYTNAVGCRKLSGEKSEPGKKKSKSPR